MNRRTVIRSAAWLALGYPLRPFSAFAPTPQFSSDPFRIGVASGDPRPGAVVLWTRLMPDPNRERDWQRQSVSVDWRIASDERMTRIVRQGRATARPEYGHSISVDANGLQPARWYWYQFRAGSVESPIGRTKTAPSGPADRIRFAFASCQRFDQGYYTAYQHMIREDIDVVVFLGDYIYETGGGPVRPVPAEEPTMLEGYRNRYALYRSDPHLREAHRLFPWIVTTDDHEVDNNYAGDLPSDNQTRDQFLRRRAEAYQAHYEWLPLQESSRPRGPNSRLYRRLSFGPLANLFVLDGRQFRSDQPCGDGTQVRCAEYAPDNRTMLGPDQERWLYTELRSSRAGWNILANQVRMTFVNATAGPGERFSMDQWSGYDAARRRLVTNVSDSHVSNPVVITGDIHSNWVGDVKLEYNDDRAPVVATEFVGTSISSVGYGS
ncbi:MAG: alkaline phosphatase D family protein, partial [Acidobacteria bacterium]|nr:alkaline phosphatase D family protein [Acidobacteriota bacterium]